MFIESFVAFTKTFLGKKQSQKGMYNSVSVICFFSLLFQLFNDFRTSQIMHLLSAFPVAGVAQGERGNQLW